MKTAREWAREMRRLLSDDERCSHTPNRAVRKIGCSVCRIELFADIQRDAIESAAKVAYERAGDSVCQERIVTAIRALVDKERA